MISEPLLGKRPRHAVSVFTLILVLSLLFLVLLAKGWRSGETALAMATRSSQQSNSSPEDLASLSTRERAGEHYQDNWMYNQVSKHWYSLWCRWNPRGDLLTRFNAERILEPDGKGGTLHRNVYHFRDSRGTVREGELCGPWLINDKCSKEDGLIHPSRDYLRMFMGPKGAAAWLTPVLPKQGSGIPTVAELFLHDGMDIRMSVGLVWNKDSELQSIALIREDARGPFPSDAWSTSSSARIVSPEEMLDIFVGRGGEDAISLGHGNLTLANLYQQPVSNIRFFSTRLASVHSKKDVVMLLDEDRVAVVTPKRKRSNLHVAIMWRPRNDEVIRTMEVTWAEGRFLRIRVLKFKYVDPKTNPHREYESRPQEQKQTRSEREYIMPRLPSPVVIQGPSDVFSPRQSKKVPADSNAMPPAAAAPRPLTPANVVSPYSSPGSSFGTYSRSPSDTGLDFTLPDDQDLQGMLLPERRESDPSVPRTSTLLHQANLRRIQSEPGSSIMDAGRIQTDDVPLVIPGFDAPGPSKNVPLPVPGVVRGTSWQSFSEHPREWPALDTLRRTQSDTNAVNDNPNISKSPLYDFSHPLWLNTEAWKESQPKRSPTPIDINRSPPNIESNRPPEDVLHPTANRPSGMPPLPPLSLPSSSYTQQGKAGVYAAYLKKDLGHPYIQYKPGGDNSVPSENPPSISHDVTIMNWGKSEPTSPGGTAMSSKPGPSGIQRIASQDSSNERSSDADDSSAVDSDSASTSTQTSPRLVKTKSLPIPKQFDSAALEPLLESRGPTPNSAPGSGTPGSSPLKKSNSSPQIASLSNPNKLPQVLSSPAIHSGGHSSDDEDH